MNTTKETRGDRKRRKRKKKEAKTQVPSKQNCLHYYVHLGGSKRPPYEQFYQCTECGARLST